MHHYRIDLLMCEDCIDDVHVAKGISDKEAHTEAERVLQDYPAAEIWCGGRLVGHASGKQTEPHLLGATALTCV